MIFTDDVLAWMQAGLEAEHPEYKNVVTWDIGPDMPKRWGKGSGPLVLLSPGTGPGLGSEHMFDSRAWYVQVFGPQARDPRVNGRDVRTEKLAFHVDEFVMFTSPRPLTIADHHIPRVQRYGGFASPTGIGGAGDRTPWSTTYILEIPTPLAM